MSKFFWLGKRLTDMSIASVLLIALSPICLGTLLCNFLILGRPIFFRQERRGLNNQLFWIIKFRSMHTTAEKNPHDRPLTSYGAFIRKYSIDELPSLWNVLKGDLSLIGPRPLLADFFYPPWRGSMRPGLTGLAQIKGRNVIGWRKKFRYDAFYLKRRSLKLDLYILWKTIPLLFSTWGTHLPNRCDYFPKPSDDCIS